jgi:hypothetical protein
VQPLLEHFTQDGVAAESQRVARAWDLYESPEVRFACRQYSNAFASAKLVIGRREVLWHDPTPILEPSTPAENKAIELLQSFAGGPTGQGELLDRMGTYFVVSGDMAMIGAYDPAHMAESKYAKWDVWSTTEVRWTGQNIRIREHAVEDIWQTLPDYIKHLRVWNRHPRRGWESDSPVLAALKVLELVGIYDDRLQAEAISRLVGAGVWMIPQGMSLPTATGQTGGPQDFMELMKEVAKIAVQDRRSAAAMVPIIVEAAAEDIDAASKGQMDFWSSFDEHVGELQDKAIRRWATGIDLPAEVLLGLSTATHWNATLISQDKVQTFIYPALRRMATNVTQGWLWPALREFDLDPAGLELWFDASAIKTRADVATETQWASDKFMVNDGTTKRALGLGEVPDPSDEELKRQMLLHMAKVLPASVPGVLKELGIKIDDANFANLQPGGDQGGVSGGPVVNGPGEPGRPVTVTQPGPQQIQEQDRIPKAGAPGRTANLSTTRT